MRKAKIKNVVALLAVIAIGISNVCGQSDTTRLDDLSLKDLLNIKVTTVSKSQQELGLAPATVIVVTRDQIKQRGYQSLLDLLYDLPDFKIDDKIYPGAGNSVLVRGAQGQQNFVILLDGLKISSPTDEALPVMENYPVNLAEQVEIVYGPSSALYGADAVSAIINIITQKPASKKGLSVDASSMAGMYGYTNNTLFMSKKIDDHAYLVISGQYNHDDQPDYSKLFKNDPQLSITPYTTGNFNTIFGPVTPTTPVVPKYQAPTQAYNLYAALHMDNFTFSFFENYSKIPSAYGNNTNNAVYNKDVFIAQSVSVFNASYKKSIGKITSATTLSATEYNLDPQSNYRNLYTGMQPVYKYSTSSTIEAEEQVDYKSSEKINLIAGASYKSYYVVPQSADLEDPVNRNDYIHSSYAGTDSYYRPGGLPVQFYTTRYYNVGSYLQLQYSPVRKTNFTLGARYDYNSRYGYTFNPRIGFVYSPAAKTTVKLLYGTAYLAPSPSDAYVQYGSFDTPDSGKTYHSYFLHLPNPGLKPIKSQNAELSIRQYVTNNLNITVGAYYTRLTGLHAIADDNTSTHLYHNQFNGIPVDYVEVFVNEGMQVNYGGSIQVNWKFAVGSTHFNAYAALSYVNGEQDDPFTEGQTGHHDVQLDFISPVMLKIGGDIKAGGFTCSPRLTLMGRQNLTGIADTSGMLYKRQTIAGYTLLNITMRYAFTGKFSVFANITNALNQHYKSVGYNMDLNNTNTELFYGQREDPIRIMGGISFSF